MSEFLSSDVMSRGASAPPASYRLFVSTPTGQTFSLRNLARTVPAYALRAQLELVAGIPSVTYTLQYGSQTIDSDAELAFGENVQSGALLSLKFACDWGRLYESLSAGDSQQTAQVCRLSLNGSDEFTESRDPDVAESAETSDLEHVRFVALFQSCQRGDYDMAKWLISADSRLLERSTQFGRTALHAAAAGDQPKVLQLLLSSGARIYKTDVFGKKPLDVATQLSCYVAERLLKYRVLRRRTAWGGDERCGGQTGSDVKCSERVGAGHSQFARRAVSASACQRKLRTQKVNAPRLSSADHHVTAYGRCGNDIRSYDSRINTWAETGVWARSASPGDPNGPCTDLVYQTVRNARSAKSTHNVHVSRATSFSAQSAKYYRGRFHRSGDDDDTHTQRPATANSRFRAWKTWLLELDEREAERGLEEEQKLDRRERNERAYRRWLAKKARDGDTNYEPEVDDHSATRTMAASRDVNAAAFQKWLDDKRLVLAEADRKRRETLRQRDGGEKKVAYSRRVTVFEFCDTDPVAAHPPSPSDYIGAYRKWLLKKRRHEAWKDYDDYEAEDDMLTREQVNSMRQVLTLDGMSHEEWLGQKERERLLGNKPLVLAPRRRTRPTGGQAVCIAVVAD